MDIRVNTLSEYHDKAQELVQEAYDLSDEDPFLCYCYQQATLEFEDGQSHVASEYKSPAALLIINFVEQVGEYLEG